MVTAELALAIPSLLAVLVVAMCALSLGATQVALVDAARIGARSAARGDPTATVIATVQQVAPGAHADVGAEGSMVVVTVRGSAPAILRSLGVEDPSATARTPVETSETAP